MPIHKTDQGSFSQGSCDHLSPASPTEISRGVPTTNTDRAGLGGAAGSPASRDRILQCGGGSITQTCVQVGSSPPFCYLLSTCPPAPCCASVSPNCNTGVVTASALCSYVWLKWVPRRRQTLLSTEMSTPRWSRAVIPVASCTTTTITTWQVTHIKKCLPREMLMSSISNFYDLLAVTSYSSLEAKGLQIAPQVQV